MKHDAGVVRDSIMVLQTEREQFPTAKTYLMGPTGYTIKTYNAGTYFQANELALDDIHELGRVLDAIRDPVHRMLVIRGTEKSPDSVLKRRNNPTYVECPHHWLMIDFDGVQVDGGVNVTNPEPAIRSAIERHLPDYFQGVTCVWQLSSSAGLKPAAGLKVHLWFWLSRPISNDEGKRWSRRCVPENDPSLFQRVQPHFVSDPKFVGMPDPVPQRMGLLGGERDEVPFPDDWTIGAPPPPEKIVNVTAGRLERFAKRLKRKRDNVDAENGETLLKICRGEAFADPGDREPTIYRLSLVIAEEFPSADPDATATIFAPSLAALEKMAPRDPPLTVEDVAERLRRALGAEEKPEWVEGLVCGAEGGRKSSLGNTLHVLARHPDWSGVLAWDEFAEGVTKRKLPPIRPQDAGSKQELGDWTDDDTNRCVSWLGSFAGFEPARQHVEEAVRTVAKKIMVHPVRDYLRSCEWDGVARLDLLLPHYFGTEDTAYTRKIGACWMISGVARIYQPGAQADHMLVLEGRQGSRKSTGLEALAGGAAWFADTGVEIGSKDSYQSLRRKWIYEFGELDSLKRSEVTKVKNFLSARSDYYRESYGHRNRDFPRQCIFAGSTNEENYLLDRSGNRRFWPAACIRDVDIEAIRRDRNMLWAEARVRYERGELWYIADRNLEAIAEEEQAARVAPDDWAPAVQKYLETTDTDIGQVGITTAEILEHALKLKPDQIQHWGSIRAGHVLTELGWQRRQVDTGTKDSKGRRIRLWKYFWPTVWADGVVREVPGDAKRQVRLEARAKMVAGMKPS